MPGHHRALFDGACGAGPARIRPTTTAAGRTKLLRAALKLLTDRAGRTGDDLRECRAAQPCGAQPRCARRTAGRILGGGEHRWVAESVWRDLTRRTRGGACQRGDDAGICTTWVVRAPIPASRSTWRCRASYPDWRLAGLLDTADGRCPPSMLWEVLGSRTPWRPVSASRCRRRRHGCGRNPLIRRFRRRSSAPFPRTAQDRRAPASATTAPVLRVTVARAFGTMPTSRSVTIRSWSGLGVLGEPSG